MIAHPPPRPPDPPRITYQPAMFTHPPPRPPPPDPPRSSHLGHLPKAPFPRFDGDNPRCWKTRAEKHFRMYEVEQSTWISMSEMHFDGPASLWYQSIEHQIPELSWSDFCKLMHDRFDHDQHESLSTSFSISDKSPLSPIILPVSQCWWIILKPICRCFE